MITSDETFVRLTGEEGYSLVLIQTTGDVTDENVQAIQNSVDQTYSFQDKRDERTTGTYMAFVFCVYAFLAIIALVTVMNIVNSISMSVSARMKQYGAMRAVGMDERQMTKMIACEAFTYAVLGCVVGCAIGLPLSKSLYDFLIAGHFHLLCGSSQLSLWALFFCLSRLRQSQLYMLRQNEFAICRLLQPSMNYSFIC